MEIQLVTILANIWAAIVAFLATAYGKISMVALFIGSLIAPIETIVAVMVFIVILDFVLGIGVAIKTKGYGSILSSRLRDSVIKLFLYLLFLVLAHTIESQIFTDSYVSCKATFALFAGVEVWSILANLLILFPRIPILKLLKFILSKEMSKKLGIDEDDFKNTLDA